MKVTIGFIIVGGIVVWCVFGTFVNLFRKTHRDAALKLLASLPVLKKIGLANIVKLGPLLWTVAWPALFIA